MESNRRISEDNAYAGVSRRQWIVAIGLIASERLEDEGIEPTPEKLISLIKNLNDLDRNQLTVFASERVEEEFEDVYTVALFAGFDPKKARSMTKTVLKKIYRLIDEDNNENFWYLEPLIFGKVS